MTSSYFPLLSLLVGVEVARVGMEEGFVDYASVNDPITSGSPVVAKTVADRKDGFPRYFLKILAFSTTNEDDLLAIWSQTTV